jgi:hypothetical protein
MLRATRLAFAQQRFELRLLLIAVLVVAVAALAIAWQTRTLRDEQLACYRDAAPAVEGSFGSPCAAQDPNLELLGQMGTLAKVGVIVTPFALGLFLGVPLVAREVEGRTAAIAWSMSRSRRRWLLLRAAPVVVAVVVACLLAGIAAEVLVRAQPENEGIDPGFADYAARGMLVPARGIAVVAIGLAMGTLIPRQLPALLLAAAVTVALFAALEIVTDGWMADAAEPMDSAALQAGASSKIYGTGYRDDVTGKVVTWEEYYQAHPDPSLDEFEEPAGVTPIVYAVPASRYGEFVLRESAILTAVALLGIGISARVVAVRRP